MVHRWATHVGEFRHGSLVTCKQPLHARWLRRVSAQCARVIRKRVRLAHKAVHVVRQVEWCPSCVGCCRELFVPACGGGWGEGGPHLGEGSARRT